MKSPLFRFPISLQLRYIFSRPKSIKPSQIPPDANNEIQLTDAIQQLIDEKCNVYAVELSKNEKRIDNGTPEFYWTALK